MKGLEINKPNINYNGTILFFNLNFESFSSILTYNFEYKLRRLE